MILSPRPCTRNLPLVLVAIALPSAVPLHAHGQLDTLIAQVTAQIENAPDAELYLNRGELYRAHGEWPAAFADYDAAEKLAPRLSAVWLCRARSFLETEKFPQALAAADQFLKTEEENPLGHRYRAEALRGLERPADAATAFARMLSLMKERRPEDFIDHARTWNAAGHPAKGIEAIEAGLLELGSLPTLETEALDLEIKAGNLDAALVRIARLEAATDRKAPWQVRRADLLAAAGRPGATDAATDALASIRSLPKELRRIRSTMRMEDRMCQLAERSQSNTPASGP